VGQRHSHPANEEDALPRESGLKITEHIGQHEQEDGNGGDEYPDHPMDPNAGDTG
jgi:hypothetical protein